MPVISDIMIAPHTQSGAAILRELGVDSEQGLSAAEVAARQRQYGLNEVQEGISRPAWKMLLGQFIEPMILILCAAAGLALWLGDLTEALAILVVVFMFGVLGFIQEYRAEKAMAALKQLASPVVRVRREGGVRELPARELVPGDMVLLTEGNLVPADVRLIQCVNCGMSEAALTGESEHVLKSPEALADPEIPLGDRVNMGFMGTSVAHGRAEGVVVATGMRTELGKIAAMLRDIEPGRTPLQRKLAQVGKHISLAGGGAAVALVAMGLLMGERLGNLLLTAVSLLVAVVPEGLPAIVTVTLALGARRMLRRNALIRRLPAVETLGAVTIICSDKTGTLTENKMTVVRLRSRHHELTLEANRPPVLPPEAANEIIPLLLTATLCNDGTLVMDDAGKPAQRIGDPTETALLVAAERLGMATETATAQWPRLMEYAFDSDRRCMTTLHRHVAEAGAPPPALASSFLAAVKGAPDTLLAQATMVLDNGEVVPLTDDIRQRFGEENERMAAAGQRVMGMAFRKLNALPDASVQPEEIETELVFCGLAGLIDPPRESVREAVERSHSAGIRTMMITGDHPLTAAAIARSLRILPEGEEARILTGVELERMSDDELTAQVEHIRVVARVTSADKLRIVEALQRRGHIAAMTGDGVNDSPALRRADIGVAMGVMGMDVAKEAAAMVLLDDNFATIVAAVEEGRTIFDNLLRYIKFSFGGNIGKVLVMFLAPLFGLGPIALLPLQLLWLNLMTDGLLGLALGLEPAERDVMSRPPRKPDAPILDLAAIIHMMWVGVLIGGLALLLGAWQPAAFFATTGGQEWRAILFAVIGFAQVGQAWGLRAVTREALRLRRELPMIVLTAITLLLHIGVLMNARLRVIFGLGELTSLGLAVSALAGLLVFAVVRLEHRLRHREHGARGADKIK